MSELTENHIPLALIPIVALGFASTQISWGLFNLTVPIVLSERYSISIIWIGFIMTWDNIIAFFIQPTIGTYSDNVRTRFGRRMPFIIPGIIFGSILFVLLSISRLLSLGIFLLNIVIFNFVMALYRAPAASLMPDMVKSQDRSFANGLGNSTAGITAGIILLISTLFLERGGLIPSYAFVSCCMIVFLLVLVVFISEPDIYKHKQNNPIVDLSEEKITLGEIVRNLKFELRYSYFGKNRSLIYILLAILTWFMAVNSIEAFYSTYVWNLFMPDSTSEAATTTSGRIIFIFPIFFVLFAILGGFLGNKIGRIKTSKLGAVIMVMGVILAASITPTSTLGLPISWQNGFRLAFIFAGSGWGLVSVNSIVLVWEHTQDNGIGTGLYYAFTSAAAVLGPTFAGVTMAILGVRSLFFYTTIFFVIGWFLIYKVTTGEVGDREEILSLASEFRLKEARSPL